jgi:hypothetical protein
VLVSSLAGFGACSDDHGPGPGGQSEDVGCPTTLVELRKLAGKPCASEGARCLDSGTPGEDDFAYECSEGTWTALDPVVPSTGGAGGQAIAITGGFAGEGGLAGQGGFAGDGGIAGDGGPAGQGGVAGDGGVAGGGGLAGEGGFGGSPSDSATLVQLEVHQRPYTECAEFKLGEDYPRDAEGIPLKLYRSKLYYNPVIIAQAGLEWLACYRESGDTWYVNQALAAGYKLVDMSVDFDGAMFFPYSIDFHLHSSKTEVVRAPWYSGMAQGQALSLFSRLGELTSEAEWEFAAASTLKTFDRARGQAEPWIIDYDEERSTWIEEYPASPDKRVLNGFMFGMFGLYDYYAWRGDAHAAAIFLRSLHTLRHNVERFRNEGDVSAYCLTHRVQSTSYHAIHIDQLRAISRMTDDPYFASVADLFALDY